VIWTARHPGQGGGFRGNAANFDGSPTAGQSVDRDYPGLRFDVFVSRVLAPTLCHLSAGSSRQPPTLRESRRVQSNRTVEKRLRIRNCAQRRSPGRKLCSAQVSRPRRFFDLRSPLGRELGSASNSPCPRGRRAVRPCSMFEVCYPGWRGRPACAGVGRSTPGWKLIGRWPEEPC
jgi:hypothetical protein